MRVPTRLDVNIRPDIGSQSNARATTSSLLLGQDQVAAPAGCGLWSTMIAWFLAALAAGAYTAWACLRLMRVSPCQGAATAKGNARCSPCNAHVRFRASEPMKTCCVLAARVQWLRCRFQHNWRKSPENIRVPWCREDRRVSKVMVVRATL